MPLTRTLRLIVALLAVGSTMTGAASSAAAMTSRSMDCHETVAAETAPAETAPAGHGGHGGSTIAAAVEQGAGKAQIPSDAMRLHLCCVLSLLVVPPLAEPRLALRLPDVAVLAPADLARLVGVNWPAPVPPPRTV